MKNLQSKATLNEAVASRTTQLREAILEWAEKNIRSFPWRENQTPFTILISEVLLRRTTATAVLKIYPLFMKKYGELEKILTADETELTALLASIGYHKKRAKILKDIANFLVEKLDGTVPCRRESLLEIPHVGSYTAGAVLSLGCGQSSAMVDTNVERVYGRVFLLALPKQAKNRTIEEVASTCVPKLKHKMYNLALLDLSALICTYGIPRCKNCPINELCDYFSRGLPSR